jgi:hypothetical protein
MTQSAKRTRGGARRLGDRRAITERRTGERDGLECDGAARDPALRDGSRRDEACGAPDDAERGDDAESGEEEVSCMTTCLPNGTTIETTRFVSIN